MARPLVMHRIAGVCAVVVILATAGILSWPWMASWWDRSDPMEPIVPDLPRHLSLDDLGIAAPRVPLEFQWDFEQRQAEREAEAQAAAAGAGPAPEIDDRPPAPPVVAADSPPGEPGQQLAQEGPLAPLLRQDIPPYQDDEDWVPSWLREMPPVDLPTWLSALNPPPLNPLPAWRRITPSGQVWVDLQRREVIIGGRVCLTEGMLEMFACPEYTKEHESVVAVHAKSSEVHAALLAIGVEPGAVVRYYEDQYQPAEGPVIDVTAVWRDEQGALVSVPAQWMVRSRLRDKPLEYPWVFAGSQFWQDPETGEEFYAAESGDLICVSNFPTATMDLPIKSTDTNEYLMYEAYTENIPPLETAVFVVLRPQELHR